MRVEGGAGGGHEAVGEERGGWVDAQGFLEGGREVGEVGCGNGVGGGRGSGGVDVVVVLGGVGGWGRGEEAGEGDGLFGGESAADFVGEAFVDMGVLEDVEDQAAEKGGCCLGAGEDEVGGVALHFGDG